MAATGQGATFRFQSDRGSFAGGVTRINVTTPTAEVVDVTGVYDPVGLTILVPTGSWKGGAISVDFNLAAPSAPARGVVSSDIQTLVRGVGQLVFSSSGMTVARQVILESAETSASTGDIIRGTLRFLMTDYYPG